MDNKLNETKSLINRVCDINIKEDVQYNRDKRNFKDDQKATRHTFNKRQLEALYKLLDNFIADLTFEEVEDNREHLNAINTMIHQHMRNAEF